MFSSPAHKAQMGVSPKSMETMTCGDIRDLQFRPGTNEIVLLTQSGVYFLDSISRKVIRKYPFPDLISTPSGYGAGKIDFSPDGQRLMVMVEYIPIYGQQGSMIYVWNMAQDRFEFRIHNDIDVYMDAAFSTDGRFIYASRNTRGGDHFALKVFDAASGADLKTIDNPFFMHNIAAAKEAGRLWVVTLLYSSNGSRCGEIDLYDMESGTVLKKLQGHTDYIFDIRLSADGKRLVSYAMDSTVRVWDVDRGETLKTLKAPTSDNRRMSLASDGRYVILDHTDPSEQLWVWDIEQDKIVYQIGPSQTPSVITLDPTEKSVYLAGNYGFLDQYDLASGLEQPFLSDGLMGFVASAHFSPDGQKLMVMGSSEYYDYNLKDRTIHNRKNLSNINYYTAALSPDGRYAAFSLFYENNPFLLDTVSGIITPLQPAFADNIWNIVFSSANNFVAVNGPHTLRVWDRITGKAVFTLENSSELIQRMAFSPDGQWLAVNNGGQTQIYVIESGQMLHAFPNPLPEFTLQFSPDGQWLALADNPIHLYSTSTFQEVITLPLPGTGYPTHATAMAFSPDMHYFAACNSMGDVSFWDWQRRTRLYSPDFLQLGVEESYMTAEIEFAPDSKSFILVSYIGKVKHYTLDSLQDQPIAVTVTPTMSINHITPTPMYAFTPTPTPTLFLEPTLGPIATPAPLATPTQEPVFSPTPQGVISGTPTPGESSVDWIIY